jgi:hypothetical protein
MSTMSTAPMSAAALLMLVDAACAQAASSAMCTLASLEMERAPESHKVSRQAGSARFVRAPGGAPGTPAVIRRVIRAPGPASAPAAVVVRYECPLCSYASCSVNNVTRHMRSHTGDRPYACVHPGCEYRSTRSDDLQKHLARHGARARRACGSPGCSYASHDPSNLARHRRTACGTAPGSGTGTGTDAGAAASADVVSADDGNIDGDAGSHWSAQDVDVRTSLERPRCASAE